MGNDKLHRAVGKLITGKVFGPSLDVDIGRLIENGTISGITLFKDNGVDLPQLSLLVDSLRRLGGADFLISVDQEGGAVQRFEHIITPMPSAMALAALGEQSSVSSIHRLHAEQLQLLGINCNLVPVLDVNSNPLNPIIATRSFGDDIDVISNLGRAMIGAYLARGIVPVGKHFPGHGDTSEDSHLQLAVVHADKDTLRQRELAPFIACGSVLPAMLVAHVWLPAFDKKPLPASLSKNVVTGLLRDELGYDGFLMTDDMPGMKAIVSHWGLDDAAVMAIDAGIDHLLMCGSAEQVASAHAALVRAFEKGTISEARLAQSLKRREETLSLCAQSLKTFSTSEVDKRQKLITASLPAGHESALDAASRAIWLARGKIPDFGNGNWVVVAPSHSRYGLNLYSMLKEQLAPHLVLEQRRYDLEPRPDQVEDIKSLVAGRQCVFLSYRARTYETQAELAREVGLIAGSDSVLVACDVPYDVGALPQWRNALATFDPSNLAMEALALVLTGRTKPMGICPVVCGEDS